MLFAADAAFEVVELCDIYGADVTFEMVDGVLTTMPPPFLARSFHVSAELRVPV